MTTEQDRTVKVEQRHKDWAAKALDNLGRSNPTWDNLTAAHVGPDRRWQANHVALTFAQFERDLRADDGPIDMVLHCPVCNVQHIDEPAPEEFGEDGAPVHWTNPPHRSHLCHGCGHIWRPADVATNGVQAIKTRGSADSAPPASQRPAEDQRVCKICDGGPGNECACSCGMEAWDTKQPA